MSSISSSNKKKRKKHVSSSLSSSSCSSSSLPSSFISKLQMLRDFVPSEMASNEALLQKVLKESSYNVQIAAEKLMLMPMPIQEETSSSSLPTIYHSSSSSLYGSNSKNRKAQPVRVSLSPSDYQRNNKNSNKKIKYKSSSSSSLSEPALAATLPPPTNHDTATRGGDHMLLCQRWVVGFSTSRHHTGVYYKEQLSISNLSSLVRFESKFIKGTLPANICRMLIPLLSYNDSEKGSEGKDEESRRRHATPLISISCEALMEVRHVQIGTEIPLSISVYIENVPRFFDLFNHDSLNNSSSNNHANMFFNQNNNSNNKRNKSNSSKKQLKATDAAFALLQWAQYGDVLPKFDNNDKENESSSSDEDQSGDNANDDDDIILNEDDFEQQDDNDTSTNKNEQSNKFKNLLTESNIEANSSNNTSDKSPPLPELSDPKGFAKSNVKLRRYQRQALHWMMNRERTGSDENNDDESLRNELKLLAELASSSSNSQQRSASTSSSSLVNNSNLQGDDDVICECSAVIVSGKNSEKHHHPLWQRRYLVHVDRNNNNKLVKSSIKSFYVNELLGIATSEIPNPPKQCVGGILADAMGLGKTVMLLSLILKSKEEEESKSSVTSANKKDDSNYYDDGEEKKTDNEIVEQKTSSATINNNVKRSRTTTLVVTPLSLISQWEEEISTKTSLTHYVYYGDSAVKKSPSCFNNIDVVITTYGTVQAEFISFSKRNKNKSSKNVNVSSNYGTMLSYLWGRIILDEAHCIKNPQTAISKACCAINATKRWCVTGTPVQNSVQDVYGLLKFLKHEPWCESTFWKAAISSVLVSPTSTAEASGSSSTCRSNTQNEHSSMPTGIDLAIDRVRRLLSPLILRRTKDTKQDGKPILTLPPVETKIISVQLSSSEREFYNSLLEKSQSVFEGFIRAGTATKSWFAIFSLLQRLRQSCDHVALTVSKSQQVDVPNQDRFIDEGKTSPETTIDTRKRDSAGYSDYATSEQEQKGAASDVNEEFLEGLLEKFRTTSKVEQAQKGSVEVSSTDAANITTESSYTSNVAHTLNEIVKSSAKNVKDECPICLEMPLIQDAAISPCGHIFCCDCLVNYLKENVTMKNKPAASLATRDFQISLQCPDGECPCCNEPIQASRIITMSKSADDGRTTTKYLVETSEYKGQKKIGKSRMSPSYASLPNNATSKNDSSSNCNNVIARQALENALLKDSKYESSKQTSIINELHKVWEQDPNCKVIIFSQFLGFLSLLGESLTGNNIPFNRLDGTLSLKERVEVLREFNNTNGTGNRGSNYSNTQETRKGSVLLVSMKAGGVGLNLVSASCAFICDPWWNYAIEDQCINRIHRIGQVADLVRVRKFVVADSVEERIVMLQHRKKSMANEILTNDGIDDDEIGNNNSRPSLDDFKIIFGK